MLFCRCLPGRRVRQAPCEALELAVLLCARIGAAEEPVDDVAVELLPGAHLVERTDREEQDAVIERGFLIARRIPDHDCMIRRIRALHALDDLALAAVLLRAEQRHIPVETMLLPLVQQRLPRRCGDDHDVGLRAELLQAFAHEREGRDAVHHLGHAAVHIERPFERARHLGVVRQLCNGVVVEHRRGVHPMAQNLVLRHMKAARPDLLPLREQIQHADDRMEPAASARPGIEVTEDDIPRTWDAFREVARKLTVRDGNGDLVQAGFSYNGGAQGDVLGMQYQYGQNLFTADNRVTLNNDAMKNVITRMKDMYEVDGVCDYSFGNNSGDNFGQGLVAMYLGWGFMTNIFTSSFPETHFDCFEIPTPTEEVPYAMHRYNGESTFGVNKNAPADQQAVAQDIIRFFLASDEIQKEFCMANAVFPMKSSLQTDADLMATPSIAVLAEHIDRYIWPGPMPSTVENNVKILLEEVFYNGKDLTQALIDAENAINEDLEDSEFVSQEPMYKYASEAVGN